MNWLEIKHLISARIKDGVDPVDLAKELNVNEYDLRQFIHRSRLFNSQENGKNLAFELIDILMRGNPDYFKPTREFYLSVGIRQKRWWALYRGELTLKEEEYARLVRHLGITIHEAFEARQLDWVVELEKKRNK